MTPTPYSKESDSYKKLLCILENCSGETKNWFQGDFDNRNVQALISFESVQNSTSLACSFGSLHYSLLSDMGQLNWFEWLKAPIKISFSLILALNIEMYLAFRWKAKIVWYYTSPKVGYYTSLTKSVWYSTSLRQYDTISMILFALPNSIIWVWVMIKIQE